MPKIRMLTSLAGMDRTWNIGEEIEVSAAEAKVFADGVRAELVRPPAKQRARKAPVERAVTV